MRLDTTFDEIEGTFRLCLRCRECTFGDWPENYRLCPIHNYHRIYTASAGGLISIMMGLSQNRIDLDPSIAKLAYECTMCGFCNVCEVIPLRPPHNSTSDMIRFLRYQLVKRGLIPDGEMKKLHEHVIKNGDFLGEWLDIDKGKQGSNTVLFAECLHSNGQRDIYQTVLKLLERIGENVDVYNDGGCCGSTLYNLGFWDELRKLVEVKSAEIEKLKDKKTIFVNPHCQEFMIKTYPQISEKNRKIAGKHISEVLADAFEAGKIKVKNQEPVKVSYHDPCYLGRELGIYDAPRKVISSLTGVELIEMKRNRGNAYCCGAGGGGGKAFPDFSRWVTEDRLKEFKETGADLLITACPYCKEAFQSILPAEEKKIVKDLTELVYERIAD